MGPPCVGKTAFKSLLFNWPAPKVHHSTALGTRPVRAIERVAERNEDKIWDRVTGHDQLKMLSDAIRALELQSVDVNDSTLENTAASTNFSSQSTSDITVNLPKDTEGAEDRNSPSIVKEIYWSTADTVKGNPNTNRSNFMSPPTVSFFRY